MKRITALLLCLLLTVSCFAGCGQDQAPTDSPSPSPEESAARDTSLENYQISTENHLTNPNATDAAKAVYNFIVDMKGRYIISGQQESPSANAMELNNIYTWAGTTAVLRGFDFINDDFENVTRRAQSWWELGGLVTICWHMGTPPDGVGYESSKGYFDLNKALQEGTDENKALMAEFDKAVPYLKQLQDANVPVIWRPFHEFDGGWFWWGKCGGNSFIELWKLMYDYYTNTCGLNNLIWMCGFSQSVGQHADWYPGNDYVDIVGADMYAKTNGSLIGLYNGCYKIVEEAKPIALHENGILPDPDKVKEDGAKWSWFMTWHSSWLTDNGEETIKSVYNNDYVLAKNRMPNLCELLKNK